MPHLQAGFTLIEVMIVVAIIAILSAIAIPVYTDYILRGRIPEATSYLSAQQVKMEQWFQDNQYYYKSASSTGVCADGTVPTGSYFLFSCTPLTATTYLWTATGITGTSMAGFTYTINQDSVKTTVITGVTGWTASSTSCWITNKGGVC
jgi:type IV pilus assembly protein PilE